MQTPLELERSIKRCLGVERTTDASIQGKVMDILMDIAYELQRTSSQRTQENIHERFPHTSLMTQMGLAERTTTGSYRVTSQGTQLYESLRSRGFYSTPTVA